jgi:predicted nucleotidyltransferase
VRDPIPKETVEYLDELVARLRTTLGADLVGVYAGGSLALGGYDERRSDVDVAVVTRGAPGQAAKEKLVASVRHESLACPARGLELVVYTARTAGTPTPAAGYELNLNTGRAMPFHLSFAPGDGQAEHWYGIDRAVIHEHGRALLGPPAAGLFAAPSRSMVLGLLAEAARWHEQAGIARDEDAVLNACRALRYAAEGRWTSKQDAGDWARTRVADGALVADALAARPGSGEGLEAARVGRFLGAARRSLEEAAGEPAAPGSA